MNNFLLYILKVSAGITVFYIFFLLFLRNDTFYKRNRIFLILNLLIPAIIPLVKYTTQQEGLMSDFSTAQAGSLMFSASAPDTIDQSAGNTWLLGYITTIAIIYFAVAGLLILRSSISLLSTFRIIRKGIIQPGTFPRVVLTDLDVPPFSFFPYAVIPAEDYKNGHSSEILDHEFAHLRQGHTFDMLLSELFIAFQWYNPFVWLIKRSVTLNHEYLADKVSLINNADSREYQYRLLNLKPGVKNISLAHNFNSLIKNRIIMINKKPTSKKAFIKNLFIIPVLALVAYSFATPEYKIVAPVDEPGTALTSPATPSVQQPAPVVAIDGVISDLNLNDARKSLGYEMGPVKVLQAKEATEKYGAKGINGVYEITTRTKAKAMGIKSPFPRLAAGDYPTFQNKQYSLFKDWVVSQAKYPVEAKANNKEGYVTVNFTVELNGSLSNITAMVGSEPVLANELVRVIKTSPAWDKPKNSAVDEAFSTSITVKFSLPDNISGDSPYVIVEEMPQYPGGDEEMMKFIFSNLKYPEEARKEKIEGRVFLRFVVTSTGKVEGVSILKGVNPLLDAEAARVIRLMSGWQPGKQDGKPVSVWFQIPVTFSLTETEK